MEKIIVLYLDHSIGSKPGGATLSLYNLIKSVKGTIYPIVVVREHGTIEDLFKSIGCEVIIAPICSNIWENNLNAWKKAIPHIINEQITKYRLYHKVKDALKGRKIDIVHSNTSYYNLGYYLAKKFSCKHVWHIREMLDTFFNFRPFWGWKRFYEEIRTSDYIITITKAVFDNYDFKNLKSASYIWDAVTSSNNSTLILKKENYLFFCAACITPNKGLMDLLVSFRDSKIYQKGIRLRIAGIFNNKQYQSEILDFINSNDLAENIDFLGYCNDIKEQMIHAKGFIMPSYNEGLGRVAVEAMFYGCPVIARASGGVTEFMEHKKNGFLFNSNQELVTLIKIIADFDDYKFLQNAQNYAIDNFSEEVYGKKIINIYKKIVKNV